MQILRIVSFASILSMLFVFCSVNVTSKDLFTVTLNSNLHGTACDEGTHSCTDEDYVVLKVCSIEKNYLFKEWVIDSGKGNCTIDNKHNDTAVIRNLRGPVVIHPEFTERLFTLTIICDSVGTVSVTSIDNVSKNTQIKINAIATAKDTSMYQFSRWEIDSGTGSISNDSITMTSDCMVRAVFNLVSYPLTITQPSQGGSITSSLTTGSSLLYGTAVTLTATPLTGWQFVNWTATAGAIPTGPSTAGSAILTANTNYSAVFTKRSYRLTVSSLNANVILNPPVPTFYYDSATTFSATVSGYNTAQYQFNNTWTVTNGSFNADYSKITLTGDAVATPVLSIRQYSYTLTTTPTSGSGTVTVNQNSPQNYGTSLTFTATPETGWKVKSWSGGNIAATDTIHATATLTGATTYNVEFERKSYSLSITAPSNGSIRDSVGNVMSGTYSFPFGFVVKLNAAADTGYQFSSWTGATGSSAATTVTMDGNKNISATFTEISAVSGVKYVWKGAKGIGNGSTWANAYTDLTTALQQVTSSGSEIWVVRGEYFREAGSTSYFTPSAGIKLYGGFTGFERTVSDRNTRLFNENFSILNGGGMDVLIYIGAADVYVSGFVLTNAQYGVYIDGANNAVVENCVLRNFSESAVYISGACASPIVRRSVFHSNKKTSGTDYTTGKGVHIDETVTNALIENSFFINNDGPAISEMRNTTTNLSSIKNCTVIYNTNKGNYPGGIYIRNRLRLMGSVVYFNSNGNSLGMQMNSAIGTTEYCDIQEYNSTRGISGSITGITNCYVDNPGFLYVSTDSLPTDNAWYFKSNDLPFIPGTVIRERAPYTDLSSDIRVNTRSTPIDIGAYEETTN